MKWKHIHKMCFQIDAVGPVRNKFSNGMDLNQKCGHVQKHDKKEPEDHPPPPPPPPTPPLWRGRY